jgi:hypothetical protein
VDNFLNQLPALLGVIVGAAASYLATSAGDKTRWMRSQRVRWEDKRVQVYADYGHAVKRVYELSKRLAASRGLPTNAGPLSLETGLEDLTQAGIERSEMWERLLLVGDPDAVAAARAWHHILWQLEAFAHGRLSDPDQWKATDRAFRDARSRFYETARHDLGITSGPLPE